MYLNLGEKTSPEIVLSEFDLMISSTAVELVNEGKAKWVYVSEGYNNIAVVFAVTDSNIDEKHQKALPFIQNKVFRVLKCFEPSFAIFSSARQQIEYINMFYNYGNSK